MRVIYYLLISLFFIPIVYAEVFPQAISTSLTVSANNCTISIDTEDNNADFDFNITSPLCNITNTSNAFTYSKQVSPLFVRNVSCGETDLENLTALCVEYFGQTDYIGNFTTCKEGKARLEESYNTLHMSWESAESTKTNKTIELTECNTQLTGCREEGVRRNADLDSCFVEKNKFETESKEYKSQRWTFAIISLLLGIAGHILWTRRGRLPRESFPQQERRIASTPFQKQLEKDL